MLQKTKVCSRCGKEKATTEFYRDRYRSDGLTADCKVCRKRQIYTGRGQHTKPPKGEKCVVCQAQASRYFVWMPGAEQLGLWGVPLCDCCHTEFVAGRICVNPHRVACVSLENVLEVHLPLPPKSHNAR